MSQANAVSTSEHVAIVGLTGGIATGKSTVTGMFRDLGVTVIDADVVAREIVKPGTPALTEIAAEFGEGVLRADGTLNRGALGDIVFHDEPARRRLNAITHPRIAQQMMKHAEDAGAQDETWVIYDAALLVENSIHAMLPGLIVVSCDAQTQLDRLVARDEFSIDDAKARIAAQLPLADKIAVADWVIDNSQSLENTRRQVAEVFATLDERYRAESS